MKEHIYLFTFLQKWTCHNVSSIIFLTICRMDVKYYFLEFAEKPKPSYNTLGPLRGKDSPHVWVSAWSWQPLCAISISYCSILWLGLNLSKIMCYCYSVSAFWELFVVLSLLSYTVQYVINKKNVKTNSFVYFSYIPIIIPYYK